MRNFENIKIQLNERREKLLEFVNRVERSARQRLDKSFEEQAIQRENEEVLTALDDSLNRELEQIENALERLEKGEYGFCGNCGEKIADKRLKALPHANVCINCAISSESGF